MSKTRNFFVAVNPKESSEKRVARFKQWFNRSRVGNLVKGRRYRKKDATKRVVRESALVREKYRDERERKKYYQ
jgi:hypothetical protein